MVTLKEACRLMHKLNEVGYNPYFKVVNNKVKIIIEYIEIKNEVREC